MGNVYDVSQNKFCTKKKGIYWLHFDSFTDDHLNANYIMSSNNKNYLASVTKTGNNKEEVDVLSQDIVIESDSTTCLQMSSLFGTFNFASSLYAMTWAGFLIDSAVVFYLINHTPSSFDEMQTNFSVVFNFGKFKVCIK